MLLAFAPTPACDTLPMPRDASESLTALAKVAFPRLAHSTGEIVITPRVYRTKDRALGDSLGYCLLPVSTGKDFSERSGKEAPSESEGSGAPV